MGAFDGNGTFVRSFSWTVDKTNSVDITASRFDTEDNGYAAGLTLCVTRDGQGKMGTDFIPAAASSYDLGSSGTPWRNGYANTLTLSGAAQVNSVSATVGITQQNLNCRANTSASKLATTSRTNSAVLADDPDLILAVPSAGTYAFELFLICPSGAGGLQLTMAYSGSVTTGGWYALGAFGGSFTSGLTSVLAINGGGINHSGAAANDVLIIKGTLVAGGTGNLSLQWAQLSGNAAATSMNAGSYLTITKLA